MRFVAWNLRSATDRKWASLRALEPDLAVIAEAVECPKALLAPAFGEPELRWEWEGTNTAKGIALAAWDRPLQRRLGAEPGGRWAVGGAVGQLLVVGVWSCPRSGGGGNYVVEVERCLDAYAAPIARHHHTIVAGDFNVAPRDPAFRRLRARFADLGLVSAYHHHTGDPFGHESERTFHARHADEDSRHIDFAWISPELADRLTSVVVGDPGPSDHSPLILEFAD